MSDEPAPSFEAIPSAEQQPEEEQSLASADPLEALWLHTLEHWDAEASHEALLAQAGAVGRLGDLARRYRERRDEPERAPRVQRQLAAITALALGRLEAERTPPPKPRRTILLVAIAVSLGLVLSVVLALRA